MTISMNRVVLLWAVALFYMASPVMAANLLLDTGTPTTLTTEALLAMPVATTIQVPADVTYHRTMTYRAVPLNALPGIRGLPADAELQITATDGFVTNLSAALVRNGSGHGAVPWLAIEPHDEAWPKTAQGTDIGPFYLVWTKPDASGVMSEQWPYQIEAIRVVASRAVKWRNSRWMSACRRIRPFAADRCSSSRSAWFVIVWTARAMRRSGRISIVRIIRPSTSSPGRSRPISAIRNRSVHGQA